MCDGEHLTSSACEHHPPAFTTVLSKPNKQCSQHTHLQEFELMLDVEKFMAENDADGSWTLEYDEFKHLLM